MDERVRLRRRAPAPGVRVREAFYRWAPARGRRYARLAQHVPDMLRYRRAARAADVVHFQWLSVQYARRATCSRACTRAC